jgi:hypothetical protein
MSDRVFHVHGKITRSDNGQGVPGLRVEAHDADTADQPVLGFCLTNRDGSYHIDLPAGGAACCDCRKIYITVRDRDCRLVYDGCADRRCCEPGKALALDHKIEPQALWWHLARPLAWDRIDEPLVPVRVMQEIEDALELLRAEGTSPEIASLAHAVCATPAIDGFDRVLLEAWGTLQGQLDAARRYRDTLDALCGDAAGCCKPASPFAEQIEQLFAGACDKPTSLECKPPAPCAPCERSGDGGDCGEGCACGAPFLSEDKVLLLLVAALHLACGDEAVAKRYVELLLEQFCRFATLGAVHAASLMALLGDAASKAHARDLLEMLCRQCGTPDPKSACHPRHPPGCCAPCLDEHLAHCLREAIEQWCHIRCWSVCEVRPPRACPGEEILIVGCGFGHRAGSVSFRAKAGASTQPQGQVKSWCDDRISVVVPQGAGCGLSIELPPTTIALCGRFLELRPTGCIEQGFEGTSAEIQRFDIRGHGPGECPLQPGEPLRIRWNTCAADRVRVELIDLANNSVIAAQDPAALSGRWDFSATNFTRTVKMRVRITAFGRCEPPQVSRQIDLVFQKRPALQVQGMEITQAVQHYRADQHLTDPADRGPDNSLRLVTAKTAWVRTYLRSGQDPAFDNGQLAGVNGTLRVERRVGGVWGTIANLAPQNGPITAEDSFASYAAERGNINMTLNFVVPANLMSGLLRFTVDVRGPFAPCPGHVASRSTQADVNLQQTLNAAFITIGYNGPNAARTGNIVLAAPSLATCQAETSWAMTTYPVSGAPNVRAAGTFVTNTPIDDPRSCPGCCSPNWGPLLTQVAALVALDQAANPGTPWVYYGLIASGIPVNVPGCSGGATGGVAGQPVTYAHEIGHQLGLPHARCGNAGNGNPNYPVYEPYDLPVDPPNTANWTMASVGEFGLDINNGAIADPATFEDFMSYCFPRWISKFTYDFLTNINVLSPVVVPSGAGAATRVIEDLSPGFETDALRIAPFILLMGTIGVDGALDVGSVARIDTRYLRGDGRQTGYVAQHLDASGRVLAEDVLYAYGSEGGCGGHPPPKKDCHCDDDDSDPKPAPFKAMLRDTAPGACLRIVMRDEVLWERKGSDKPPQLGGVKAALAKTGDLTLSWKADAASKEPVEVWVRWSNDDGKTWHALTVGLRGGSATIPAEQLPSGSVRFELLAHDGFHTARATTEAVVLAPRPPAVTVLYPADGARVFADRLMHLWGTATSHAGAPIASEAHEWFIDDKPVGRGHDLWVDNPGAGRHTLRLVVREGALEGGVAQGFEVLGGEAPQIG